jgi:hypothetical protein
MRVSSRPLPRSRAGYPQIDLTSEYELSSIAGSLKENGRIAQTRATASTDVLA